MENIVEKRAIGFEDQFFFSWLFNRRYQLQENIANEHPNAIFTLNQMVLWL